MLFSPGATRRLFLATIVLAAAACQAEPPRRLTFPDITFANREPIRLDVASVEIVNEYVPPLSAPNVEHTFPVSIAVAAERWGRERILPAGSQGVARIVVRDASAREAGLKRTGGVRGLFTTDQSERYDARVEVTVEVRGAAGNRSGYASATAQRSRTVAENLTLNEREQLQFELVEALMKDLDAELERNIRQYMSLLLR
ncbi:MAG: hypothetical protein KIT81_15925 [Alphaproteobacteria bacterium]|nr:hypothetical protein [Alphaproteobacteria bacterium]